MDVLWRSSPPYIKVHAWPDSSLVSTEAYECSRGYWTKCRVMSVTLLTIVEWPFTTLKGGTSLNTHLTDQLSAIVWPMGYERYPLLPCMIKGMQWSTSDSAVACAGMLLATLWVAHKLLVNTCIAESCWLNSCLPWWKFISPSWLEFPSQALADSSSL